MPKMLSESAPVAPEVPKSSSKKSKSSRKNKGNVDVEKLKEKLNALSDKDLAELKLAFRRVAEDGMYLDEESQARLKRIEERGTGKRLFSHVTTLADLREVSEKMMLRLRRGVGLPTYNLDYHQRKIESNPNVIRGQFEKMMLPTDRVVSMCPLVRLGEGSFSSPRPLFAALSGVLPDHLATQRDGGWAVYARTKMLRKQLSGKYGENAGTSGKDGSSDRGQTSSSKEQLYRDVVNAASRVDLTLACMPSRDLKISEMQAKYGKLVEDALDRLGGSESDKKEAKKLIALFDTPRVQGLSWVKKSDGGAIKADSYVFFSSVGRQGLRVEVMSPGRLKDKKMTFLGEINSDKVRKAVFDVVMGEGSVDQVGKQTVGEGIIRAIRGELEPKKLLSPLGKKKVAASAPTNSSSTSV